MNKHNETKYEKKKYQRILAILAVLAVLLIVASKLWILPYLKRHFKTVEINREEVILGESIEVNNRNIVTVYFTRVGNTDFDEDVDAVSGASLLLDENKELLGNSQVIAQMVQDAVGRDVFPINVQEKYPSSYSDTVSVASDELKREELPELVNMPDNIEDYDTVILIYPLWWNTLPKPVETFLSNYDFSDKTVIPIVTHGGSGVGKSVNDLKTVCNGLVVENPLEIYCDDIPYCRERVTEWLKEVLAD